MRARARGRGWAPRPGRSAAKDGSAGQVTRPWTPRAAPLIRPPFLCYGSGSEGLVSEMQTSVAAVSRFLHMLVVPLFPTGLWKNLEFSIQPSSAQRSPGNFETLKPKFSAEIFQQNYKMVKGSQTCQLFLSSVLELKLQLCQGVKVKLTTVLTRI